MPLASISAIASTTMVKNLPSAACINGIRCGGCKMAIAAGRRQNSAKTMPPTHTAAASRCTKSKIE